ncbi:MAG: hypothetical protein NC903_01810, partial [Candidatus Omnitrophica bacterium]|nr:hypothetical protein [Candidatus Omnitrophota bacterium]
MSSLYKEFPKLYLIDATAFCYRAFYALRGLSTSWGQPTNAIYGFVNMLTKIIKENKPQYIAICFDVSRKTFRQEKFSAYKITRPSMPDDLAVQIPWIKKIISAYGICYLEREGFEADDIIATLVERFKDNFSSIIIVSSDKDILQLVDEKVVVISPYKDKEKIYTEKEVIQRYGVKPSQIPDILALMGDSSDNIPGILGIGEKTAVELIKRFYSLENLKNHLDKIGSLNIKNTIKENLPFLELSHQLIKL